VHQRARACAEHLKALQLEDDSGALVRFCQRCSKWEPLAAFEVRSTRAEAQRADAPLQPRGRTAVGTIRPKLVHRPAPTTHASLFCRLLCQGVKRTCTAQLLVHNERRRAEYARSKASAVRTGAAQTQQEPAGAMPALAQPTAAMIQQYVAAAVAAATSAQAAAQVQVAQSAVQHHATAAATAQQLTQVAPPGQPQAAALAAAAAALQNGGAGGEVGPNGFQAALAGMLVGLLSNGAQPQQQQAPAPTVTPELWQQLMAQQRPQ
jgi:hypothetical protein